ncbi:GNAT family N-acetyltransferase [Halosimplex sp. TS25]|uniref:GNAT family N-acetyltransferase n=1 Tax=Halosimplex rarum TaxID=3396619 RepID=UPI0039EB942A
MNVCAECRLPMDREHEDERCGACVALAGRDLDISVAPLERTDLELVLAWRSNTEVYRHFRDQDAPLEWEDHVEWFESRDVRRHDFVISYDERRVGVVSLDDDDAVSVYLGDVSARGQGVATNAVRWLCDRFADRAPLFADVHADNDASKRLFEHCGFERKKQTGDWIRYVYES